MATNYILAFAAGALSFFAPCVVPLLPAYVSYLTGAAVSDIRADPAAYQARVVKGGLLYVVGFGLVFVSLGIAAGIVGQGLKADALLLQRVGGAVVIVMGLALAGLLPDRLTQRTFNPVTLSRPGKSGGAAAPLVLGVVFGTAWTPCVGPVLASILVLAANTHQAVLGGSLLTAYTLGLGLPFVVASLLLASFPSILRPLQRTSAITSRVAGLLMIGLGVLLILGSYTQIAGYLAAPFGPR
ncbi:MAG: cytochrome c biogenesis protein CcdA [Candidatus Dormibacteraceae bacterium]